MFIFVLCTRCMWKLLATGALLLIVSIYLSGLYKSSFIVPAEWRFQAISGRKEQHIQILPEIRHIGFLKVHKAASSTMQNVFFRFGMKRNLTFVFTTNPNYFSRTYNESFPVMKPTKRNGYDIMCIHGIFNERFYTQLLPSDSVYIGIIRDPVSVFISAVNYYSETHQLPYLGKIPGNKLRSLIENPDKYDKSVFSYTRNVMARDFGFNATFDSVTVQKRLAELDQRFRLVLLAEYFDESLVLMKRHLRWKMEDIVYMSTNVFSRKGWSLSDLNETHVKVLQSRNQLDFELYKFFYSRFWEKFRDEHSDIHNEVLQFKEVLKTVNTFCNRVIATSAPPERSNESRNANVTREMIRVCSSRWNEAFTVTAIDCEYMTKDELKFIKTLRRLQGSVINETSY